MLNITSKIILFIGLILMPSSLAWADAWWGHGSKSFDWILKNGGTIIRWQIEDISKEADNWKAVMFDSKGKYVEVEYGQKGVFDDAKNGVYTIKAYKGIKDHETHKGGKLFASITVTAHPGETINIKFNYKNETARMTTNYVRRVAKKTPPPKPAVASKIENVPDSCIDSNNINKIAPIFKLCPMIDNQAASVFKLDPMIDDQAASTLVYSENSSVEDTDIEETINKSNAEILVENFLKIFSNIF
ncbi:MAG TPA: hypothetical protein P5548_03340 [Candidatus Moranbacteria bacterium]|nr:hypothetical protein [Candidatus Moranbacteria bacterium]HRZ33904.1 hypothetical protein [Candidatus Moranbacteria bacterium]